MLTLAATAITTTKFELPDITGLVNTIFSYFGLSTRSRSLSKFGSPGSLTNNPLHAFEQYVQIRTDHPEPDYYGAVQFLEAHCRNFNISVRLYITFV